jgi:NAD+ kinase
MNLLLVSRIDDTEALNFTKDLAVDLQSSGHKVNFDSETAELLGTSGLALSKAAADIVVIVGGDGTILRCFQQMKRQIPLIGINWGDVAFLADIEPSHALAFLNALPQNFVVEERMRIAFFNNGVHLGDALNEALIVTTRPAKMLRFSIDVDGITAHQFRADGLLISTPTGSTAYAMSAGGPIVDPLIQGFLLVPLAPYMLSSRPHLISSKRQVRIKLESVKAANLVIDGQRTVELGTDDVIEIKQSKRPALFVDAKRNFFAKVDSKLRHL